MQHRASCSARLPTIFPAPSHLCLLKPSLPSATSRIPLTASPPLVFRAAEVGPVKLRAARTQNFQYHRPRLIIFQQVPFR
ncbi:hypothetical protein BOTBODRAFT_351764 [Botryobasidium botryosum FD-172 SS1]|uniref:Uncharacterized protein n=1 Tax=Botryobasidium botryosum (strain FD-172 SS1) TaxID=930990 RepID=A0A067MF01_BOTB1|nr:hypothetical protein BOTBODRAFT_351764 [Botryobasidium botryosum FD-172 SS1]